MKNSLVLQNPKEKDVKKISELAKRLREKRREVMAKHDFSLRDLYKLMESTPNNPVTEIQNELDKAVNAAYGIKEGDDILEFILNLNYACHKKEESGKEIISPGLPLFVNEPQKYISEDCVRMV